MSCPTASISRNRRRNRETLNLFMTDRINPQKVCPRRSR